MALRDALTIVYIDRFRLVRADFARRGDRPTQTWIVDRPDVNALSMLTEFALQVGPRPGRKILVLSTDIWAQVVLLDASATAMVEAKDMNRILAFEIEPLSNLSAFDAALHYLNLDNNDEHRTCWVNSLSSIDLSETATMVRRFNSQLLGIAHPSGVPLPMAQGKEPTAWQRLELWPDLLLGIDVAANGKVHALSLNYDPRQADWQPDVARWQKHLGTSHAPQVLYGEGADGGIAEQDVSFELQDRETLGQWLGLWGRVARKRSPGIPIVRPPRRPLSVQERAAVSVGMAAVALLGCIGYSSYVGHEQRKLQAEIEVFSEPGRILAGIKKASDGIAKDVDKKKKEVSELAGDLETCRHVISARQRRIAILLDALAASRSEHVVVQQIEVTSNQVRIHGLALRPEMSDRLATALKTRLQSLNWYIDPALQTDQLWLGNGGPWQFEIRLVDRDVDWSNNAKPITLTDVRN